MLMRRCCVVLFSQIAVLLLGITAFADCFDPGTEPLTPEAVAQLTEMTMGVCCAGRYLHAGPTIEPQSDKATAELRESLLELDFTQQLESCEFVPLAIDFVNDGSYAGYWVCAMRDKIGGEIPDRPFTVKEARRLGIWKLPSGGSTDWHHVLGVIAKFHKIHGRLPANGVEALPQFASAAGIQEYLAQPAIKQLTWAHPIVNLITGRIYDTFQASEWAPGAISVTIITDPEIIARDYGYYRVPVDWNKLDGATEKPSSIWLFTIYGEQPGTELLNYIWPR